MRHYYVMVCVLLLGSACSGPSQTIEPDFPGKVTIYSGRSESLVGTLLAQIETETGLDIEVQYGGTAELATRLLAEGDQSPADLFFAQDPGHLGVLAERGVFQALPDEVIKSVSPEFRDGDGAWVGTSGRLRVLVMNTEEVLEEDRPKSIENLADPKWKGRMGWAPGNGSFQTHVTALRHVWGDEKTREWLKAVEANSPIRYPKNSPQVAAAQDGAIQIGWVNHYYLHRFVKNNPDVRIINYSFPTAGDPGNVMMVSGIGMRKGTSNEDAALRVIKALLSEAAQRHFSQENYEYPTVSGVSPHADLTPLDRRSLVSVDTAVLADVGPTREMLMDLGLL